MSARLAVTELTVGFGALLAVADVSFSVADRSIVGLIGPNGAGKTTTIDAICGFVPSVRGHVTLGARAMDGLAPHERARAGLVRTFQSIELFDDLTVAENVLAAATRPGWSATLLDAFAPRRRSRWPAVDATLGLVGLADRAGATPRELSHGQRRLVSVARAIAAEPSVLLLDEPAAGLDPTETAELATVLRRVRERGIATVLVDHDMTLVLDVCDALVVLDVGRVIASGPTADVRTDPAVTAAYLGTEP